MSQEMDVVFSKKRRQSNQGEMAKLDALDGERQGRDLRRTMSQLKGSLRGL